MDDQFKFPDDEEISHGPNNKNKNLKLNNNSNEIINQVKEDKFENIQTKEKDLNEESEGSLNNLITNVNNIDIDIDNKIDIDKRANNNFFKR